MSDHPTPANQHAALPSTSGIDISDEAVQDDWWSVCLHRLHLNEIDARGQSHMMPTDDGAVVERYIATLLARIEADAKVIEAAYHLLDSDQCRHAGEDWHDPICRVCNLRRSMDTLSADQRDRLASSVFVARTPVGRL